MLVLYNASVSESIHIYKSKVGTIRMVPILYMRYCNPNTGGLHLNEMDIDAKKWPNSNRVNKQAAA
jgi:hypothetical protein